MSFKEILGQEKAVALLKGAFLRGRASHAYIFVGPAGVGKSKAAISFAKLLVCPASRQAEPCDVCPSCRKADAANHPDIQVLSPDGQFIRIDAVREACRRLSLKGFESSTKVLIISDGAALNDESSNALLKTLEEPAPDTVIIILATSLKAMVPTIVSRCQRIVFSSLQESVIFEVLRRDHGVGEDEAFYLSRISEGCMEAALRFHQEKVFMQRNRLAAAWMKGEVGLLGSQGRGASPKKESRQETEMALYLLAGWLRDILVAKISAEKKYFINADRIDDIMHLSRKLNPEVLEGALKLVAQTTADLKANVNMRLALARLNSELQKIA
ncbi:MAG: DNA polymerase III subunit delta' [Candidatus Omnitrophica bacterium]|nr:DNA polymerase III subunit delta' [Candidatus Omnitrophota bacterium]MDD5537839.1 DNA polymerase III subunit delta' [Candidatus Omnitrophota bacterium]